MFLGDSEESEDEDGWDSSGYIREGERALSREDKMGALSPSADSSISPKRALSSEDKVGALSPSLVFNYNVSPPLPRPPLHVINGTAGSSTEEMGVSPRAPQLPNCSSQTPSIPGSPPQEEGAPRAPRRVALVMQSSDKIEALRLLHLSKRERAEENWNRKAEEEALADEELLKNRIAEAFAELEQARLSKLSKPVPVRSHDMETRGHALP